MSANARGERFSRIAFKDGTQLTGYVTSSSDGSATLSGHDYLPDGTTFPKRQIEKITNLEVVSVELKDGLVIRGFLILTSNDMLILDRVANTSGPKVIEWANAWDSSREANFPVTELPVEKLRSFAVSRINDILSINADWRFKLDPDQGTDCTYRGW